MTIPGITGGLPPVGSNLRNTTVRKRQGRRESIKSRYSVKADAEPASGLILAGGQSRRMGEPKAALPFGDSTILERLIAELIDQFSELIVIAAPRADETYPVEALLRPFRDRVVLLRDETAFAGPVPALIRGLRAAQHPAVFACSCDLPLIRRGVARELCRKLADYDAVIPQISGRSQPL